VSPVESIKSVFSKYATFSGRARRSEYWWFVLANAIVGNVLYFVTIGPSYQQAVSDQNFSNFSLGIGGVIYVIYVLVVLIPGLAVLVRRLHDTGRSGWHYWMALIPFAGVFIVLYYLAQEGTSGQNAYGSDPKA
jgi:uncharacterized membrane protein YhaH (DUF805 family)